MKNDATQGHQVDHDPSEDPTQGTEIGGRPGDDATVGAHGKHL